MSELVAISSSLRQYMVWFHVQGERPRTRGWSVIARDVEDAAVAFSEHEDSHGCDVDEIEELQQEASR